MASGIDPTVPVSPTAFTADMRANFLAAKLEIEALQVEQEDLIERIDALDPTDATFLPLTGGTLTGRLLLPPGSTAQPALGFGADDDTGLYRSGLNLGVSVQGVQVWLFNSTLTVCRSELEMMNFPIRNIADAVNPADAMNRRASDARYAPIVLVNELQQLRTEIAELRHALIARGLAPGLGMHTELLPVPAR